MRGHDSKKLFYEFLGGTHAFHYKSSFVVPPHSGLFVAIVAAMQRSNNIIQFKQILILFLFQTNLPNLKNILTFIVIFMPIAITAKPFKLKHALDIGLTQSFSPSNKTRNIDINPYVFYTYSRYKKYAYPSLRLRYLISHPLTSTFSIGAEAGVTLRYQEKVPVDNYYTFYSFPIMMNAHYSMPDLSKKHAIAMMLHAGYHYKHPKNKMLDGTGGFLISAELALQNKPRKLMLKLGYELQQDHDYFLYKPELFSQIGERQMLRFQRLVNGIYFSVMVDLN